MDRKTLLQKPLLLLVDDEPNNLRVLAEALRFDYEIAIATSGAGALQFLENDTLPDLILLDVMMPGMDGYEVCQTLKQHQEWNRIPIIFVTAATDSASEQRGFEMGAVDYIHKPFDRAVVLARIRSHLSVHGMMDRLSYTASRLDASIAQEMEHVSTASKTLNPQMLLMDAVFDQAMEGITVTDGEGCIRAVNPAFTRITGYAPEDVVDKDQDTLRQSLKRSEFSAEVWERVRKTGHWQGELINRRHNGETYPELRTIHAVSNPAEGVTHYVSVFSDISATKQKQSTIDFLTWYDALTALPNRLLMLERLETAMQMCQTSQLTSAVMILDIDRFKAINESMGLEVGDRVLRAFADRLSQLMCNGETIARIDGDKFAVLLPPSHASKTQKANRALEVATELQEAMARSLTIENQDISLSVTVGITLLPGTTSERAADALRNAETAHHKAKLEQAGSIVFFSERMGLDAMERFYTAQALRHAVGNGELRIYLQSQCDTDGKLVGAETLLRWEHPDRGLVSPTTFIPLAESTGFITTLDRWVIDQMLEMIHQHQGELGDLRFAINISADHFAREDFVSHLITGLHHHRLSGHHLTLELTESVMVQELRLLVSKLRALAGLGIEVSIDDFGTGYSSLSYLQHLPIQELKIDRSFTQDIGGNQSGRAIVSMIHNMAAELNLRTVVEGVETEEQWQYLKHYPNTVVQGYYFSKPQPMDVWLATNLNGKSRARHSA
ncbi:GGDEF/EAL domain-containing response regulator [Marinobacter xestospongiae]|uniref:GGDEF/EAL domain-containing response regulator n=1 Tax=Marinobacter xestospongiae TaxID=994319 RepID=UPI0020038156|nr:EAL domain-containing protein [Marinobacter xestospongiae]MCK7568033.1 EAL domain-containing protein [Marinobacter xestospongiae]